RMESQYRSTSVFEEQSQARAAALSGIEFASAILELPPSRRGNLLASPKLFHRITLEQFTGEEPVEEGQEFRGASAPWRFSLVNPAKGSSNYPGRFENDSAPNILSFGLQSESAKLHLPTLLAWDASFPGHAQETLMRLPGATAELVDALLEEVGASPATLPGLAEGQSDSFESSANVEAKLKRAWVGDDWEQNYHVGTLEQEIALTRFESLESPRGSADTSGGTVLEQARGSAGWQHFLTWHSGHRNLTAEGKDRINLNAVNLPELHSALVRIWPAEWANFVIAYRQYGSASDGTASSQVANSRIWIPDLSVAASVELASPFQLVDATVSVPDPNGSGSSDSPGKTITLQSPFSSAAVANSDYLERLLDEVTTTSSSTIVGRVDLTEASPWVLNSIPGISEDTVNRIVEAREDDPSVRQATTVGWLVDKRVVGLDTLKELEPFLTNRSDVYSTQAVGYRDAKSAVFRMTVILDTMEGSALWRRPQTWHAWGSGFPIDRWTSPVNSASQADPRRDRENG
ncbi:MAG: hypothetical protein AAF394_06455, partial [Planctomycetota bacterium]